MLKVNLTVAAAAVLLVSVAPVAMAQDASDVETVDATAYVGSEAAGITGTMEIGTNKVSLGNIELAKGTGPGAYNVPKKVKSFSKTVSLPLFSTLTISSGPGETLATSPGQQGSTLVTNASVSITDASADVSNALAGDLIKLTATSIASTAKFTTTASKAAGAGTTTIDTLNIALGNSLVAGGVTIPTYSGKPPANYILYQTTDKSIIIYLNRQTKNLKTITAADVATPTSIEVDAVDVHLTNASVLGNNVTGDVRVGVSYAN
jgi:hypothetical protein